MTARVVDLFVYPIKACQPVRLKKIELGDAGAVLDRIFCVADADGDFFPRGESLSMRNCPPLGGVRIQIEKKELIISAECMKRVLKVPIELRAYANEPIVEISCSGTSFFFSFLPPSLDLNFVFHFTETGLSTTSDGGWSLGGIKAKYCGADAENWFTEYLGIRLKKRFAKKKVEPRFILVRSAGRGRNCSTYAGPLQLPYSSNVSDQRAGKASPFNMKMVPVLDNDRVHFADSFPFLLTSIDSLNALRDAMDVQQYPMTAFRPNIVVDTGGRPFEEEQWGVFRFSSCGIVFRQLKLCPRCTVPSRDPMTGEFLLKDNKLCFMKTLRKMFPVKTKDSEWGEEWEGATFGVLCAHNGVRGKIVVGETLEPVVFMHRPNAHGHGSFGGDNLKKNSCIVC